MQISFALLYINRVCASENTKEVRVIWPVCAYLVLRADPPTWGRSKSTPNGAFLSVRKDLSSAICSRSMSGVYPTPPITPSPPAFVTAAASLGPAATFMPASRTG